MNEKIIKKNSIAIGIMLSSVILSEYVSFLPKGIIFLIFIPFFYLIFINKHNLSVKHNSNVIVFLIVMVLFCVWSIFLSGFKSVTIKYVTEFLCLGIPFLLVSKYHIDAILVFRTIVVLGTISIPSQLNRVNIELVNYIDDGEILMQISYNLLKASIASILLLAFDRSRIFKLISLLNIWFSFLFLFMVGSRGAALSFLLSIVLVFLYYRNRIINFFSLKMILLYSVSFLFLFNIVPVLEYIMFFMYSNDIKSIGLDRIIDSMVNDVELSTGRGLILEKALQGFFDSPLFGNGIGSFDNYSGKYTHNIVTQALYEGGLVFGAPIVVLVVYSVIVLNSKMDEESRWIYIYLISSCLIQLMLSSYFWCSSLLWFMFGILLRNMKYEIRLFSCNYVK